MIIAIDPGIHGAIAHLDEDGALLSVQEMPILKDGARGRALVNAVLFADMLTMMPISSIAYLEAVSAMPGQGVSSSFGFGRSRGIAEGVLAAFHIPVSLITAATWKRLVGIPAGSGKDVSRGKAISRWPTQADVFKRVRDEGRAEAALLGIGGLIRAGKLLR